MENKNRRKFLVATASTGFLGGLSLFLQNLSKESEAQVLPTTAASAGSGKGSRMPAAVTTDDSSQIGFLQNASRAVVRSVQSKLADQVSVFDFMTQTQIDDVKAAKLSVDVSDAIQAALTASRNVYFPEGSYRISKKLIPRSGARLTGASPATKLTGFHQGVIIELPYTAEAVISTLTFQGPLCTGIGVSQTVSNYTGYLIASVFNDCAFQKDLAFGINGNMINCRISKCSFGVGMGVGAISKNMVGIRSYPTKNNSNAELDPNVNEVTGCTFYCGQAGSNAYKVQLQSATNWVFKLCDFESGGPAVYSNDTSSLIFDSCWFEGNTGTYSVNLHLNSSAPVVYRDCSLNNNNCAYGVIQYARGATYQLVIENCSFGLTKQYPLWDQTGANGLNGLGLPGDGYSVVWTNNVIYGANPSCKIKTTTNRGGTQQLRGWGVVNGAGTGSVIAASDPDVTIGRTALGNLVIYFPHALASSVSKICVTASSPTAIVKIQPSPTINSVRILTVDFSNKPIDAIVHFSVMGI